MRLKALENLVTFKKSLVENPSSSPIIRLSCRSLKFKLEASSFTLMFGVLVKLSFSALV